VELLAASVTVGVVVSVGGGLAVLVGDHRLNIIYGQK
jgi:hypothetical protein